MEIFSFTTRLPWERGSFETKFDSREHSLESMIEESRQDGGIIIELNGEYDPKKIIPVPTGIIPRVDGDKKGKCYFDTPEGEIKITSVGGYTYFSIPDGILKNGVCSSDYEEYYDYDVYEVDVNDLINALRLTGLNAVL